MAVNRVPVLKRCRSLGLTIAKGGKTYEQNRKSIRKN